MVSKVLKILVASLRLRISSQVSKWMLYSISDLAVYHQIQQAS